MSESNPFVGQWRINAAEGPIVPWADGTLLVVTEVAGFAPGVLDVSVTPPETPPQPVTYYGNYDPVAGVLTVPTVPFDDSTFGVTMSLDQGVDPTGINGQWWLAAPGNQPTTQGTWTGNESGTPLPQDQRSRAREAVTV